MHRALLLVIMYCLARCGALPYSQEPLCTSRYYFEEKILEKVLRMELWVESMKARMDNDLDKAAKDIDKFTHEFGDMKKELSDKIEDVDNTVQTLETKADTKLQDVKTKADEAIHEIKQTLASADSSLKPNVVFLAKDVNGQPSSNQIIKFTSTLENVGLGYNLTTGCFTTPVNGTYWFSAQICSNANKHVTASILIRGNLAARSYGYIKGSDVDTASVQAVSVLQVGDTVCLKTGPDIASSAFYNSERYCFCNFMGGLIN